MLIEANALPVSQTASEDMYLRWTFSAHRLAAIDVEQTSYHVLVLYSSIFFNFQSTWRDHWRRRAARDGSWLVTSSWGGRDWRTTDPVHPASTMSLTASPETTRPLLHDTSIYPPAMPARRPTRRPTTSRAVIRQYPADTRGPRTNTLLPTPPRVIPLMRTRESASVSGLGGEWPIDRRP